MKKLNLYKPPYVLTANLISKGEKSKNIGRIYKLRSLFFSPKPIKKGETRRPLPALLLHHGNSYYKFSSGSSGVSGVSGVSGFTSGVEPPVVGRYLAYFSSANSSV